MEVKVMTATRKAVDHINAAATSQAIHVLRIPKTAHVIAFFARVKTAFAGVTNPTAEVGVTGDTTRFIAKQPIGRIGDLKAGWNPDEQVVCEVVARGGVPKDETSHRFLIATFRSSAGNLSSLTAGEIEFVVVYAG